jgi:hypothetical protein
MKNVREPTKEIFEYVYNGKDEDAMIAASLKSRETMKLRNSQRHPEWDIVKKAWEEYQKGRQIKDVAEELRKPAATLRDWMKKLRDGAWVIPEDQYGT